MRRVGRCLLRVGERALRVVRALGRGYDGFLRGRDTVLRGRDLVRLRGRFGRGIRGSVRHRGKRVADALHAQHGGSTDRGGGGTYGGETGYETTDQSGSRSRRAADGGQPSRDERADTSVLADTAERGAELGRLGLGTPDTVHVGVHTDTPVAQRLQEAREVFETRFVRVDVDDHANVLVT